MHSLSYAALSALSLKNRSNGVSPCTSLARNLFEGAAQP